MRSPLPIDALLPEVARLLTERGVLILETPPGTGKTTRVPPALRDLHVVSGDAEVVVLEPRRIAARLAAERVARERGGRVGEEIGYQIRFEDCTSPRTRIRFVTEGVLRRRLEGDPTLSGVGAVVFDEFHERTLDADLSLALLREVREVFRPDLRLVVMSATLESARVAPYLDAPVLTSPGQIFPLKIEHTRRPSAEPLETRAGTALLDLLGRGQEGSVLVFLPGWSEIRRAAEWLAPHVERAGYDLCPLHGDLPLAEQERAVRGGSRPRVVLATNVAEASLTVEGVRAVIDSGLARVARFDPSRGITRLRTERISRASAVQRAGRAARLGPGLCVRLYTEAEFENSPASLEPEVLRSDLAEVLLFLHHWGVNDPGRFRWLTPPDALAIARAESLLEKLGALAGAPRTLTTIGREMLRYPTHPRNARILIEAERLGARDEATLLVALLGERDLRLESRTHSVARGEARMTAASDLLVLADLFREAEASRFAPGVLDRLSLDGRTARRVGQAAAQLRGRGARAGAHAPEEVLLRAILAGHPDRVVRRHDKHWLQGLMVGALGARLDEASCVRDGDLYVALEAREILDASGRRVSVRTASRIEASWLRELWPEAMREEEVAVFDPRAERVRALRRTRFHDLLIDERETGRVDGEVASRCLATAAAEAPERALTWSAELESLLSRLESLWAWRPALFQSVGPEGETPTWASLRARMLRNVIEELSAGRRSFEELRRSDSAAALERALVHELRSGLEQFTPARQKLPSGREARLEYRGADSPILAARLQDFFGSEATPRVNGGRVPVLLHLLAPNQRPLQVTEDLGGFWDRVYPKVRGELSRRYPKHSWPMDPRQARPEARPGRPR